MRRMLVAVSLFSMSLSACCTMQACPAAVTWTWGASLENGTYVITACVDDDCDESTVTFEADGTSSSTGAVSRVNALPTLVAFQTGKTDGLRATLEIKRDGALIIEDARSLTWTTELNEGACSPVCRAAAIALESEPPLPVP